MRMYLSKNSIMLPNGKLAKPETLFLASEDKEQAGVIDACSLLSSAKLSKLEKAGHMQAVDRPAKKKGKQQAPVKTPKSPWVYDPEILKDKTLSQLNVLVQNVDASVEPFSTTEEAQAWVSQDFNAEA